MITFSHNIYLEEACPVAPRVDFQGGDGRGTLVQQVVDKRNILESVEARYLKKRGRINLINQ